MSSKEGSWIGLKEDSCMSLDASEGGFFDGFEGSFLG